MKALAKSGLISREWLHTRLPQYIIEGIRHEAPECSHGSDSDRRAPDAHTEKIDA
jgi:hypothetical protein